MSKKMFLIGLICLCGMVLFLNAVKINVTGKWELTTRTPRGERKTNIEFIQDGEKLTVLGKRGQGKTIKAEGTVRESQIEWSLTRQGPKGTTRIIYKGTVSGDTMKGQVQIGKRGVREWSAKRMKSE